MFLFRHLADSMADGLFFQLFGSSIFWGGVVGAGLAFLLGGGLGYLMIGFGAGMILGLFCKLIFSVLWR